MIEKIEEFLRKYYEEELFTAAREGKDSIIVDYTELDKFDYELAEALLNQPKAFFENAKEATENIDLPSETEKTIKLRIKNLPEDEKVRIKDLRSKHLGKFIKIEGTVRRASEVMPELEIAIFECPDCGEKIEVPQTRKRMTYPSTCPSCGRKRGFKQVDRTLSDSRWIAMEDLFEEVSGEKPGEVNIYLKNDLTVPRMQRKTDPGARLEVSGVVREIPKRVRGKKTKKLDIFIEANHIQAKEVEFEELEISEEDEEKIKELSSDGNIYQKLINSLAPSMHGMREIKESIALQLFGGVPHKLPDGTKVRGDIHVLLVGDPGTGKCVSGDTNVTLANGEVKNIKDVVEETHSKNETFEYDGEYCFSNHDLMTLNADGKISENKGVVFWKRNAPEYLYRVTTASGREVKVTPEHPFFVFKDGQIRGEEARNISEGEMIATPRKIPAEGEYQDLEIDIERSKANAAKHIDIPEKTSPELCRFIGYLLGEEYSRIRPKTCHVSITNSSEEVIEDFKGCMEKAFSNELNFSRRKTSKNGTVIYTSSIELGKFLEELEPSLLGKSTNKKIPPVIFKCSNEEISNLLRGYFDGDATVSKNEKSICVTSASEELIEGFRNLLFRLGIFSQLSTREGKASNSQMSKKKYYRLRISGENVDRYYEKVGFIIPEKSRKLEKLVDKDRKGRNLDFVPPISNILLTLRRKLRMTQDDFPIPRTTYQHYERGDRHLSRKRLNVLIETFEKRTEEIEDIKDKISFNWNDLKDVREELDISQRELAENIGVEQTLISQYELEKCGGEGENKTTKRVKASLEGQIEEIIEDEELKNILGRLKLLANSDIYWDKISSMERVKSEEDYVYDLQVNPTHNFIANNMFVHNTQLMKMVSDLIPRGRYVSGKGTSAAGLCVTGDSLLMKENGELTRIDKIVENEFKTNSKQKVEDGIFNSKDPSNLKIMSFDKDEMKVKPLEVEQFWKIKSPGKLVRIKTQLGKEIKTTPENPIPVFDNGEIKWIKAEKLTGEENLVTPRNLDSFSNDFEKDENIPIYEFLDKTSRLQNSSEIVDDFASEIKADGGIRHFCNETDIGEDSLYYAWRNDDRRGAPKLSDLEEISNYLDVNLVNKLPKRMILSQQNGHEIDLPKYINEDLMYFLGLLAGDGDLYHTWGGGIGLRFCNSNEELLSIFSEIAQDMGVNPYLSNEKDKTPYLRFGSKIIGKIALQFGMPIGEKRNRLKVTEEITRLPDRYITSYLRGLFDTDGYVNRRKNSSGSCTVGLSSSSEEFIRQIQMLLLRFGIRSKLRRREPSESIIRGERIQSNEKYLLVISQKDNMEKFKREIGFDSSKKRQSLDEVLGNINGYHTNVDLVPGVGKLIKEAREELDISARELYGNKNYSYERGRTRPSRKKFKEIVNKLKEFGYEGILENIADSDIFFEGIKEVEKVDAEDEWVYDLTVKGEHSFVTNGMVVHNTASVVRDEEFMGGWVLEAGALVLSNKSLLAIDEFDKMTKEDQVNLHEGMSTQTVSISKASIQATLPARTSIIGGANPKLSRFDPYRPINEQIDIPQTILSRFDIRFTLRDVPDEGEDEKLVDHIIEGRVGKEGIEPEIDPDFLKKYVAYARETCYPEMTEKAASILKNFYVNMRNKYTEDDSNSVPLSLRQYEALLRLSEASAKIKLKDEVSKEDAQRAIGLMKESLKQLGMDPETGNIDIDRAEGGTSGSQRSKIRVVMDLMDELEDEMGKNIPMEDLVAALEEEGLSNADKIIREMKQKGMIFEPRPGHIQKI